MGLCARCCLVLCLGALSACSAYDRTLLGQRGGFADAATGDSALRDAADNDASVADASTDGASAVDSATADAGNDAGNDACVPLDIECQGAFTYTPSNFDPVGITHTATPTLACGVTVFDSTTLTFTNWCSDQPMPSITTRTQASGPDVVVLGFASLTLSDGATLQLIGDKPVTLAVYGDATINGTIDASGSTTTPGAGGNWSCGASAGGNGAGSCGGGGGGGGGAGFATNGAVGGQSGAPGAAGVARGNGNGSPLIGGCNGGNGGGCATVIGGGGGGAVQLSAAGTVTLGATARVLATGGAGLNGGCGCSESGGGGGGSGGAVVIEGSTVSTVAGASINADGGKGGNGVGGTAGGNGGTGTTAPVTPANSANGAGGGGGAVGRGYIRGITSCALPQTSSVALTTGGACPPVPPAGSTCRLFTYTGHNYFFCDEITRNWDQARAQCQSVGFELVRVDDADENAFLLSHLTVAQPYALGGTDVVVADAWRWNIGDTHFWQGVANGAVQNGLYANWNAGEPNGANPQEDFAYILNGTGKWNDDDSPASPFICESL